MVSILGNYSYTFPQPIPLKLRLKDMLEDNVDEKYYLSGNMINYVCSRMPSGANKITTGINMGNKDTLIKAGTPTTGEGSKPSSNYVIENEDYDYSKEKGKLIQKHLKETLEQREKPIKDKSFVDGYNRKIRDDGLASTISTRTDAGNDTYIALTKDTENYIGTYQYAKSDNFMNGKDRLQIGKQTSDTIQTTPKEGIAYTDLRIRKLIPKECGRLMNVKNEDISRMSINQSDSSMYHLFGDSICTNVLMAIFGELLGIDWKQKLEEMLYGNIQRNDGRI